MFKRCCIFICAALLLLFAACANKPAPPAKQPDGTFLWNGLRLISGDIGWDAWNGAGVGVSVPKNVLTTNEQTLSVFYRNGGGIFEYNINEFIQVNLEGIWYTVEPPLLQAEEPLILEEYQGNRDPVEYEKWEGIEHTVDFSVIGELPPGKYRLIETFYEDRRKNTAYAAANFWVIKPGGKRPPESETTGKARKEDIILCVQSLYEARREITDNDALLCMYLENLSGKQYVIEQEEVILEMKQIGKWQKINYQHVNAGLISGWENNRNEIFLDGPLKAEHYRIRLPIHVFDIPRVSYAGQPGSVELAYEFDVIAHKDAPEPKWEISRLGLSPYDTSKQSTGVVMSLANPVVDKNNTELEITITADKYYTYGEYDMVEVLLEGKWYRVPPGGGFLAIGYSIGYDGRTSAAYPFDPVLFCGVLPKGQYRLIKEFDLCEYPQEERHEVIAKEFAAVEFTVSEMLEK